MGMISHFRALGPGLAALALSSCTNPYALSITDIRYPDGKQRTGVIQVTDAKLYSREALINERRDEIEYLEEQLEGSRTQTFEPQIIRELEVISSLSAAIGLKFSPTEALNFQRDLAQSEVKDQIDDLKLQLALESLQKDAELFRKEIAERETASSDLPTAEAGSDLETGNLDAAASQLTKAVADLHKSLGDRLNAETKLARTNTNAKLDPSDLFLDRAAYRDLIKSAMTAERLDDLHDKNGAALMRFHFAATVLPPEKKNMDTLGVLRMEVEEPEFSEVEINELYLLWLNYVNRNLNLSRYRLVPVDGPKKECGDDAECLLQGKFERQLDFYPNPRFYYLGTTNEYFRIVIFEAPRDAGKIDQCGGFRTISTQNVNDCLYFYVAIPVSGSEASIQELSDVLDSAFRQSESTRKRLRKLRLQPGLATSDSSLEEQDSCASVNTLFTTAEMAEAKEFLQVERQASNATRIISTLIVDDELDPYVRLWLDERLLKFSALSAEVRAFVNAAAGESQTCGLEAFAQSASISAPAAFKDFIEKEIDDLGVRIYEVGPRERAQQLSTVARASDAIGLAAAIAGELPSAGIGLSGDVNYSRTATGKADARERSPLVVSFAEPAYQKEMGTEEKSKEKKEEEGADAETRTEVSDSANSGGNENSKAAFGWLLGPRIALNPKKQKLELHHYTAPYELTADLSMPGWWPHVTFDVQTAWAPDWRTEAGSTMDLNNDGDEKKSLSRKMHVDLAPNASDMASLTNLIVQKKSLLATSLYPSITKISPQAISACAKNVTLRIEGDNIWRSERVIVGGQEFKDSAVRVTPDMNGVLVDVDPRKLPQSKVMTPGDSITVRVMNQDGEAEAPIFVRHTNNKGECKFPPPAKPDQKPKISKITPPSITTCDPDPAFVVSGANLNDLKAIRLGTVAAPLSSAAGTKSRITVQFPAKDYRKKFAGLSKTSLYIRTGKGEVTGDVALKHPEKCD